MNAISDLQFIALCALVMIGVYLHEGKPMDFKVKRARRLIFLFRHPALWYVN